MNECNSVETLNKYFDLSDQKNLDYMKSIKSKTILMQKFKKKKNEYKTKQTHCCF